MLGPVGERVSKALVSAYVTRKNVLVSYRGIRLGIERSFDSRERRRGLFDRRVDAEPGKPRRGVSDKLGIRNAHNAHRKADNIGLHLVPVHALALAAAGAQLRDGKPR